MGPAALPYLIVAAAGVSAAGAYSQAQAQKSNANYQAQVAANNATIAKQNANYSNAQGEQAATAQGLKNKQTMGGIIAAQSSNGLDVNSGSNLDVQASASKLGQFDQNKIINDTARRTWNFENQSSSYTAQSGLDKAEGQQDSTAGFFNAGSSILAGATTASMFMGSGAGTSPYAPDPTMNGRGLSVI